MKGRQIFLDELPGGGEIAVLLENGRIEDLLIEPADDPAPRPEAVYFCRPLRPMKGLGGTIADLGRGQHGFLRRKAGVPGNKGFAVQVAGWAEPGKAPPVTDRVALRGRNVILTPGQPGINVSRDIRDPDQREALRAAIAGAMPRIEGLGAIIRTSAANAGPVSVLEELRDLVAAWEAALDKAGSGVPGCLLPPPSLAVGVRRDWAAPDDQIISAKGILAEAGIWDEIDALAHPRVNLATGHMVIEPTTALVAVDVNTGRDVSPAAGLKTNLEALKELPRQLRLRGLGGQVVVDLAPMQHTQRKTAEQTLKAALRRDGIETSIAGWTPLGHLELQRKRIRRPADWAALQMTGV